jgi:hypothetical protein
MEKVLHTIKKEKNYGPVMGLGLILGVTSFSSSITTMCSPHLFFDLVVLSTFLLYSNTGESILLT